jgi:aspartate/methionine/tyrosine aminotransferase
MVPAGFQAQNRSLATSAAAQRVQQLCQGANLHAQQTVAAALDSGDQMGQQLGAFLAERTIAAAEQQRQALIQQYLQAQGVQVDPKPQAAPDGNAA